MKEVWSTGAIYRRAPRPEVETTPASSISKNVPLFIVGFATLFASVFSCGSGSTTEPIIKRLDTGVLSGLNRTVAKYTEEIGVNPASVEAYFNRGLTYKRMQRYQEAAQDFGSTLALDDEHKGALVNRALAYTLLGMDAAAEVDIQLAVALGGVNEGQLRTVLTGARVIRDHSMP